LNKQSLLLSCILITLSTCLLSQPREIIGLDANWQFLRANDQAAMATDYDDSNWRSVSLPHTWNALDMLDDEPGYLRDTCWYRKSFIASTDWADKKVFIRFEGANQDVRLFLNGTFIGAHHGGYTAFAFDLTPHVLPGSLNTLAVEVSNAHNPSVPPVGGDLGHFGGIYRSVSLLITDPIRFEVLDHASPGVFFTPLYTEGNVGKPEVKIRAKLVNGSEHKKRHTVRFELRDNDGQFVAGINEKVKLDPDGKREINLKLVIPTEVTPWSPDRPELYTMVSYLLDRSMKQVHDRLETRIGFRSLELSDKEGFQLNGKRTFIRGVGKHQDFDSIGYAVPDSILVGDIDWIKHMGANLVRSHYPLSAATYSAADSLGVMAWVKLPIMDKANFTPDFMENSANMLREMILQNYNHPSVIFWGYSCELFGDMDWYWPRPKDPEEVKATIKKTIEFTRGMELLTRKLDPTRFTANDFHTDPTPEYYLESGLVDINQVNGWNIYQGWYHRNLDSIGDALDEFRNYNPDKPYIIAEYGVGSDPRINTDNPTIFDFSNRYQDLFHEHYLEVVKSRPWIIGMCIWTLFDFQVDGRRDAVPHINSKGLLTADRKPKDAYYLYQSNWSDVHTLHIADYFWEDQWHQTDKGTIERQIRIHTNSDSLEITINGFPVPSPHIENGTCTLYSDLGAGEHIVRVKGFLNGNILEAERKINIRLLPEKRLNDGLALPILCINAGQSRTHFSDPVSGDYWLACPDDTTNVLGMHNGSYVRSWPSMAAWEGIREGIDKNIRGTDNDPVFQTFLADITRYHVPLSPGRYEVTLLFTEPYTEAQRIDAPGATCADVNGSRIFDVLLNGVTIAEDLDLASQYGVQQAVEIQHEMIIGENGLTLKLVPEKGSPVLSGIKIRQTGSQ